MSAERPQIFADEYYRRLFEAEDKHWWSRAMRALGEDLLGPSLKPDAGWQVLDAGCGTGVALEWIQGLMPTADCFGIDFATQAIEYCHTRNLRAVATASVLDLPFDDEQFNLITCLDVIQHMPLPEGDLESLKEFARVLKPGGLVFIRSNAKRRDDGDELLDADFQRYTLEIFNDLFTRSGFEVVRLTYVNYIDALMERLSPKRLVRRPGGGAPQTNPGLGLRLLPPHLAWLNPILYRVARLEGLYLGGEGRVLPMGHSTMAVIRKK